jgi:E3 ubiquitin-protein ligase RAD18
MSDCPFDIPNSTDWLETPLSLVSPLESSLRCQVCKDFFNNPVITSCSHTFCSLCIRRCLSTEGKCPVCRSSDQELKLRRNWAVQEIVDSFRNARPGMLSLAKHPVVKGDDNPDGPTPKKRRLNRGDSEESSPVESRTTRLQSRSLRRRAQVAPAEVIEDSGDEDFVPGTHPNLTLYICCRSNQSCR